MQWMYEQFVAMNLKEKWNFAHNLQYTIMLICSEFSVICFIYA